MSPYIGASVNYTIFYDKHKGNDPIVESVHYDNKFGYAFQAGLDWNFYENWGFNIDVKKLFLGVKTKVKTNGLGTARTQNGDIDPWIFGAGLSYRF